MIESADDDLLPRMSLLLSPKPSDYEEDSVPQMRKKPVSFLRKTSKSYIVNGKSRGKPWNEFD